MSDTPAAFHRKLVAYIPQRVLPQLREIYFDATTQLYEAIVDGTPVDTGYLRAGLLAATDASAPPLLPPRAKNAKGLAKNFPPAYETDWAAAGAQFATMLGEAMANLVPITIGFQAEYAPYVEDRVHMVKSAQLQWRAMVETAIANAEGA